MVAAECRHTADTGVTIGLMRRRSLRLAIRRLNDYDVAGDRRGFLGRATRRLLTVVRPGRHRQDRGGPRIGRRVDLGLQGLISSWSNSAAVGNLWSHDKALAAALRRESRSDNPLSTVIVAVSGKLLLLLFDKCEHGIDVAHPQSLPAAIVALAAI